MSSIKDGEKFLVWPSTTAGLNAAVDAEHQIYANYLRALSASGKLNRYDPVTDVVHLAVDVSGLSDEELFPMEFRVGGTTKEALTIGWNGVYARDTDGKYCVAKPIDSLMTGVVAGYAIETQAETWFPQE